MCAIGPLRNIIKAALSLALLLGAMAAPIPSAASDAVALVVAAEGDIFPVPTRYAEAMDGDRFDLAADAELTLFHYAVCRRYQIRGGTVSIDFAGVATTGDIVAEAPIDCPEVVRVSNAGHGVAGVVLRGDDPAGRIDRRPVFIVIGGAPETATLEGAGLPRRTLAFRNGAASWPVGETALRDGAEYRVTFNGRDGARLFNFLVDRAVGVTVLVW